MPVTAVASQASVAPPRLARIAVVADPAAALPAWRDLLGRAPASPYQVDRWLMPWIAAQAETPSTVFAFGYDDGDAPVAMLPLGLVRRAGVTVARFLGGRDSNTGLALFDPHVDFTPAVLRGFLDAVGRQAGIDLFVLRNQPAVWDGHANPLAALPHSISPSRQHEADLGRPAESFLQATLSRNARKHIRQKEAKLAAAGPVEHRVADSAEAAAVIADWLLACRGERFGPDRGGDAALLRMMVAASAPDRAGKPAVELHALACGPAILAAMAVTSHAGRMSGMLLSFDATWARFSPGELLVARVIADACRRGFTSFDLGIGEARYKDTFCPRAEPLFDTILGVTPRGRLAAAGYGLHGRLKRRMKASPRAWAMVVAQRTLRRRLRGLLARRG